MGFNLSDWALRHRPFVVYCMIVAVIAGITSFTRLGRNEDPAFVIKTMIVQAAWPGANLNDTLLQVTERLERTLQEIPSLDFLRSYTTPGQTTIFVNLKQETTAREVPDIWYHVRKSIGDMRHTLPQGVIGPGFNDEFGETFGIIYGFVADGFTHRELRDKVEDIRSRLLQVPDVSKIEILGAQDERIFVEFSIQELATLGIDRATLLSALQAQNIVSPAGTILTGNERLLLRVTGAFNSEQDLLAVNFVANGRLIRLRDIAQVHRGFVDPPQPLFRVNGHPAIGLAIAMREGGDILALGRNLKRAVREITADLPVGIEPILVANQSDVVDEAISEFTESLWQAIAIIMAVSFISLGVRAGTVVALSIPLTLAITFPIMEFFGIDLQRISLGALIIALALLVDDAMTTIDVMTTRLSLGDSKEAAATFAYRTLAFAMLTGSFVTAAGFVPIGFARSSAGEYTFSIFAVVGITLIVSWLVAVVFMPLLGVALLKPKPLGEPGRLMTAFRSVLVGAMRLRWITIGITLACFVAAILALPLVPRQFFPASDRPDLLVDLRLPQNASIYASEQAAVRLDGILRNDPDVARWSTYIGRGAIRFYLPLSVELPNDFFTQAVVVAKDVRARERLEAKLERALAEQFPGAVGRVSPLGLGPPVGWPVQYRVIGPDITQVREIALQLATLVATNADARRVNFDWMEPARMVRVRIDQDQARLLGLSSQALASVMNTVVTGVPVTQVRDDIYLVDVVARATDEQRVSLATLRTLQVPLPGGRTVPLSQFASFDFEQEYPLIWRRDRVPTLTVQADVAPGALPEGVVAALAPAVEKLNASLPAPYRIDLGGTVEESEKSRASVFAVIPLMLFLMITFLMVQLQSFNRLFLVLSVVPLGLIGVIASLLLFDRPLGFVAILGILSLFGMIARNAVILIEQVEAERAQGVPPWDAVIEASVSRFRPITLTAISTVLGMIPIAVTIFWGPMAFAVMGGLLVATALTLIFLPALYVAWFRIKPHEGET
ncbi:efflux RND transporter permease subunit [Limobrevibacterium gyesilva]|uniref:Efflux RND transporter permease subunit n=1 Tax=Limobrevibacterium gyesilva TaxID=2991712 RepID=A0AA42CG52_9PROT|nr:efflux RND transporter permease subunit [Limobrevibacterium gyesilva]